MFRRELSFRLGRRFGRVQAAGSIFGFRRLRRHFGDVKRFDRRLSGRRLLRQLLGEILVFRGSSHDFEFFVL